MRSVLCAGLLLLGACAAPPADTPPQSGFERLGQTCVDIGLDQGCTVIAAGLLNDGPGGQRLYWQMQDGASAENGVGGGLVLFEEADGQLTKLIAETDAWRYEAPIFVRDGDAAPPLLVVHGTSGGTAASPVNIAWEWRGGAWHRIGLDAWHDEAEAILGEGSIQNGFRIDFETLLGVTPLWRRSDGHCCPSGGWALINFALRDGVLHVTDASARDVKAGSP